VVAVDADTALRLRGVLREGRKLGLEIGGRPGQVCEIETSDDLLNWVPHSRIFVPETGVVQIEDSAPASPSRFFRVRPASGE